MSFQHYGKNKIGEWIDRNIEQAKYLHQLATSENIFESATEPVMSAVCLRYKTGKTAEQERKIHHEVAAKIEKEGKKRFGFLIVTMTGAGSPA